MAQSQPLTGSAARAAEVPANETRPGQVPVRGRAFPRLCILSVSATRASDGTLAFESCAAEADRLARLGFGLGLGLESAERAALGWKGLAELVQRIGARHPAHGFVVGASSEQAGDAAGIGLQLEAVAEQATAIEAAGGVPLLLPLAALSRRRAREEEYVEVYRTLLARVGGPVLIDWTGVALRPELYDYFPGKSFERVMALEPAKVRGARFAVLDVARETRLRRELLTRDQLLFTADRGHLGSLLLGANPGTPPTRVPEALRHTELAGHPVALGEFSHAMLPSSFARAEALADALARLAAGDASAAFERLSALR